MNKFVDESHLVIVDCDPAICINRDREKNIYLQRGSMFILEAYRKFEEPNESVKTIYDSIDRIDGCHILD